MNFLEKLGFTADDIEEINNNIPDKMQDLLTQNKKLVTINITYLKDLGITNYQKIFIKFYDLFLTDCSNFNAIFDKYDVEDLKNKLIQNVNLVEYL